MKMCKWCNRIWGDDMKVCRCGSMDFAGVNEDWLRDWEIENTIPKQRDGSAEAEFYQYLLRR